MFQGSIPQDVRNILFEATASWQSKYVAVACSGNLTVERVLHEHNRFGIYGCDVSIYSCALGMYFARKPLTITMKPEYHDSLGWMLPGMESQVGTLATLILMSNFSQAIKPHPNKYYLRLMDGYRRQWNELHEKTVARLESVPLRLVDFHCGDAADWLDTLPPDTAVISFPPFFAKGYEKMWQVLDQVFRWDKPLFKELFEAHRKKFIDSLMARDEWLFMTSYPIEEYQPFLRGLAQTTLRGIPMYLYSPVSPTRIATPNQHLEDVRIPRLMPGDRITAESKIGLTYLNVWQFQAVRSLYLNPSIEVATRSSGYAVTVDGKMAGVFALRAGFENPAASRDSMYLLTDFAVAPTDYARLSKLVLYAVRSKEVRLIAERENGRRIRTISTTAFSDNPISMKYRGIFDLYTRVEQPPGKKYKYMLNYHAPAGSWTLQDGLLAWLEKHGELKHGAQ